LALKDKPMTNTRVEQQPSEKPLAPAKRKRHWFRSARRFVVNCFLFFPRLLRRGKQVDEVVVYSAHPAFFLWIVILTGFGLSALVALAPGASWFAAWAYIFVLTYFIIAILYDLSAKKLLLWTGVVLLFWLAAKYVEHLHNVAIAGWILKHFAALDPKFDSGTVLVMSWLLLLPWIGSLFEMYFNRRKKFSPNEISEFHFGEGSELTDRSGLRFVTRYRDVLETLLGFGGGDLLAVDNQHNVIKRYENIIGLWFHWKTLDRILHQRATLLDDDTTKEKDDGANYS
jgi:hypothetical protein